MMKRKNLTSRSLESSKHSNCHYVNFEILGMYCHIYSDQQRKQLKMLKFSRLNWRELQQQFGFGLSSSHQFNRINFNYDERRQLKQAIPWTQLQVIT